jgi:hypothetical protein
MALYAFDGASPSFDLAASKAAGGIVVSVYVVGNPGGMAHADAARVAAIRAAGMGALPNWERAAGYFDTCTVAEAKAAGVEALAACKSLGFPADGSIACAFSFDFDCPASRFAEMGAKVDAVTAGLTGAYLVMVYAQQDLIDYLVAHGHLHGKQWLMASTWGNPYHPSDANVCVVQGHDVNGNWVNDPVVSTDINTVTDPHALRAWWPDNSPYGGTIMDAATAARFDKIDERLTALFATDTDGSGKPEVTGTVQGAIKYTVPGELAAALAPVLAALASLQSAVTDLQAAVARVQTGGVDPVALAEAIAQHIKLAPQ